MLPDIDPETVLVGLLGHPVRHSLSPAMHNAAFAAAALNWRYHAFDVTPHGLSAAVKGLQALGFCGVNATIPHKEQLLALVDECSDRAIRIGAINTLKFDERQRIYGDNTDAPGFIEDLRDHGQDPAAHAVLVLGAGGSARAVVYGLLEAGCQRVHVANRSLERAERLCADFSAFFPDQQLTAHSLASLQGLSLGVSMLVNSTSVGLNGQSSPWSEDWNAESISVVYDLIYNPAQTPFLKYFHGRGCRTINGLGMLAGQGRLAWSWWTGKKPPKGVMRKTLEKLAP
jgi:shikimate dehydrogenase